MKKRNLSLALGMHSWNYLLISSIDEMQIGRVNDLMQRQAPTAEELDIVFKNLSKLPEPIQNLLNDYRELHDNNLDQLFSGYPAERGITNLMVIAAREYLPLIKMKLFQLNSRLINQQDSAGKTALHYALSKPDNVKLVIYLIKNGCDVTIKDQSGTSPENLIWAYINNRGYFAEDYVTFFENEPETKTIRDENSRFDMLPGDVKEIILCQSTIEDIVKLCLTSNDFNNIYCNNLIKPVWKRCFPMFANLVNDENYKKYIIKEHKNLNRWYQANDSIVGLYNNIKEIINRIMETLGIKQKSVEPRYATTNISLPRFGDVVLYSKETNLPMFGHFGEYTGINEVKPYYDYRWLMDGLFYSALIGDVDSFVMLRARQIEKTKLVSSTRTRTTVSTDAAVAKDRLRYYTAALEGHNQIIIDIIEGKFDPNKSIPSPYQESPVAVPMFNQI